MRRSADRRQRLLGKLSEQCASIRWRDTDDPEGQGKLYSQCNGQFWYYKSVADTALPGERNYNNAGGWTLISFFFETWLYDQGWCQGISDCCPCKEDDHSIQIRTGNNGTVFFRRGCSGWHIRGFFDQNGIGGRLQWKVQSYRKISLHLLSCCFGTLMDISFRYPLFIEGTFSVYKFIMRKAVYQFAGRWHSGTWIHEGGRKIWRDMAMWGCPQRIKIRKDSFLQCGSFRLREKIFRC